MCGEPTTIWEGSVPAQAPAEDWNTGTQGCGMTVASVTVTPPPNGHPVFVSGVGCACIVCQEIWWIY